MSLTATPLMVNFKKFAADKSAYFMNINLEYTNDAMAFIAGPEGFAPEEILTMLTDNTNDKLATTYFNVAKTKESKQEKIKEELAKLIADFVDPKVGGCKTLKEAAEKAEVDEESAALIAEFAKHVEGQTQTHTTAKLMQLVLDALPENFHKADIRIMLTDCDDCDELLETYVRLAVIPGTQKLAVRNEIVGLVESFAEAKGIVKDDVMCF